ncbi:MAG TPA: hypothetical protein VM662_11385 [Sphingomonas sp.]|nr:hypothetical protein [Sphingomonas sp.]
MPDTPPPEPEVPQPPRSLADRLVQRARSKENAVPAARAAIVASWWIPVIVAALIWLGPLTTMLGAKLLADDARREAQSLRVQLAPRIAAKREAETARAQLADALRGPGPSATLEALARVLPAEASVARVARESGGAIEIEIAAPDPDKLRAALRRAPEFARLRAVGQQAGDGAMLSKFRVEPQ